MTSIRILIADDHGIVRSGVRSLVAAEQDLEVVAEAADGLSAVQKATESQPDVAVIDIQIGGIDGIEVTKQLKEKCPNTRVLILTMHDDPAFARSAIAAGAAGYVVKRAVGAELVLAIRALHEGRSYLNVSLSESDLITSKNEPDPHPPHDKLSPREQEVLRQLAEGYTNQEISDRLSLSAKTVATYRSRIGEKLGLRSRTEIIRYALRHGLLGKED